MQQILLRILSLVACGALLGCTVQMPESTSGTIGNNGGTVRSPGPASLGTRYAASPLPENRELVDTDKVFALLADNRLVVMRPDNNSLLAERALAPPPQPGLMRAEGGEGRER